MSAEEKVFEETKILFSWKSLSRPFKKRERDFFTTIAAIVFLICVILLFVAGSWPLIAVILAFTFLVYVLNTVPPEEVEHKITNKGLMTGINEYVWSDLTNFFFTERDGQKLVNINTKKRPYKRVMILVDSSLESSIRDLLIKHIEYKEKPEIGFLDKASDWLSKKIPLEK